MVFSSYLTLALFLLISIDLPRSAIGIECVPPYLTCPNGGCSLFSTKCICDSQSLLCPDLLTCVTSYDQCIHLLPAFFNESIPISARVRHLVGLLTLQEKVSQLTFPTPAIERLGITSYSWAHEALHGVARENGPSTVFPQVIGLGATFDTDLIHSIGKAISDEARAKYIKDTSTGGTQMGITFYAPNINIYRDPRWGRGHETPGEDPFLSAQYAINFITGLQRGEDLDPRYQAVACCKHYVAYNFDNSTAEGVDRHSFNAVVSATDLQLTYFPAFRACARDAQAQTVMCSYNALNGVPTCASSELLNDVLRNDWNFEGFALSDEGAINDIYTGHHYTNSPEDAAIAAISAGCDQELPPSQGSYYPSLVDAVNSGKIKESVIDTAVSRLMTVRMKLGLLDNPFKIPYNYIPYSVVGGPSNKALTLEAARKSIVLLKNDKNVLPLDPTHFTTVAVIGPNAAVTDDLLGNYAGNPTEIISILTGIQNHLDSSHKIIYQPGCAEQWCTDNSLFPSAVAAAKSADVVILVIGIRSCAYDNVCWIGRAEIEGEQKDRTSLDLPGYQTDLVNEVYAAAGNKPVVVVLVNGGPLTLDVSMMDSLLEVFYPGEQGGTAVADVLFGNYNPGGRLPVTWVKSISDLPDYTDMSMTNRTYRYYTGKPLFPFGHGLSYTTFSYSGLSLSLTSITPCTPVFVTVSITNTGNTTGDEVIQVYISLQGRSTPVPQLQLVAFQRVNALPPTVTATVTLEIQPEWMVNVDHSGSLVIEPGQVALSVGGGQPGYATTLQSSFVVTGSSTPVSSC